MITVEHAFGLGTDWAAQMASGLGGTFQRDRLVIPPSVYTGTHLIYSVNSDITVMLADVCYHQDVLFQLRNKSSDFVGIYYNLTEGESQHLLENGARPMGRWNFNLAVVDSRLNLDYHVKAGAATFNLCIFIKRETLRSFLAEANISDDLLNQIFDINQNTIVRYSRMSTSAWRLLEELRERNRTSKAFPIFLAATVYRLLGDYLDKMNEDTIVIEKLDNGDLSGIIAAQQQLLELLEEPFPGIDTLARTACMSTTKFKKLYVKITGLTPSVFFMTNKIERARALLHTGKYNILEVTEKLKFTSPSHLSAQFKSHFGMQPKEYSLLL
ncbi:helix-turn-helix domain-containing protein [Sphingobacterium sp. MYb382]|uniref:helix-turn-helix domain-containing protein n=1 Tax=Sphingobacterium sp. MYb382 TaxID=2745278 RepID=UPI0030AB176E